MIAILDFGSQYSELIARRIRECHVYSEVLPHDCSPETLKRKGVKGIILKNSQSREYGTASLFIDNNFDLFEGLWLEMSTWMSHGDSVDKLPEGFQILGHTEDCPIAAMGHHQKKYYGVQFHPEVVHTPKGGELIRNFVIGICEETQTWTPKSFIDNATHEIRKTVGKSKVLCALSGGVDSSVVAALMHQVIGDQLLCMFIDQGFMRKGEQERIRKLFEGKMAFKLIYIDARTRFVDKIKGVVDPEEKRKLIGEEFIRTFEEEVEKLGGEYPFLAQGTLYPDIIESASVGVSKTAVKIKTHHNVGGLPEDMNFKIIEPLKTLFKDEVRKVGLSLGLDEDIVFRQPFPGPGLAIRIIGDVTAERVKTLQDADVQDEAGGIAEALGLAQGFCHTGKFLVILGDNMFEEPLNTYVDAYEKQAKGARLILKKVPDPERYGVAVLSGEKVIRIEEKPKKPKSSFAVTGVYFYDQQVFEFVDQCAPSQRGELEITDVNNFYIDEGHCYFDTFDGWWTDAGTFPSYHHANQLMTHDT